MAQELSRRFTREKTALDAELTQLQGTPGIPKSLARQQNKKHVPIQQNNNPMRL